MKKTLSIALVIVSLMMVFCLASCSGAGGKLQTIKIGNAELACGVEMSKVLDAFSDYEYEYSESISCAYNGLDKIYDYTNEGFCIYTYPVEDKDFILEIVVTSEDIKQADGKVYVGMSKDEVIALYGEDFTQDGDCITYVVKDEQTAYFMLYEDKVIEYGISIAQ